MEQISPDIIERSVQSVYSIFIPNRNIIINHTNKEIGSLPRITLPAFFVK
jgi:hypothetical protein